MKKYNKVLIYILSSLIGIQFVISYVLYSRLNNLNKTLDQLYITNSEKDLKQINSLIFESHFKDDLVLSNFNISITIIISFFTVLIALGAVFSFKKIEEDLLNMGIKITNINNTEKGLKKNINELNLIARDTKKTAEKLEDIENNIIINRIDSNEIEANIELQHLLSFFLTGNDKINLLDIFIPLNKIDRKIINTLGIHKNYIKSPYFSDKAKQSIEFLFTSLNNIHNSITIYLASNKNEYNTPSKKNNLIGILNSLQESIETYRKYDLKLDNCYSNHITALEKNLQDKITILQNM